jgi:glycosyltransferase involved in cell wall biosynthesis
MDKRGLLLEKPLSAISELKKPTPPDKVRPRQRAKGMLSRLITIIIPAHNEEGYLGQTLEALLRQNYPWLEVIVVANGCTDRTAEVAKGKCDRLIVLSQKSLGVARNLGARMARGELIVFLDADTTLEPLTLQRIAQEFSSKYAAATIRGRPDCDRLEFRLVYMIKNFMHRSLLHAGSSGVIICWKYQFVKVGGFDERLEICENSDLIRRLKQFGQYKYIGDVSATTSMRRYEQRGFRRLVWLWFKLWLQSIFGDLHHKHYETVR